MDPDARERQRTLDVDMALHLSRARHGSVSVSPVTSPLTIRELNEPEPDAHRHHEETTFPTLFPHEECELEIARGGTPRQPRSDGPYRRALTPEDLRLSLDMAHHLAQHHEPHLLGSLGSTENNFDGGLPLYQPSAIHGRQTFDFESMENFAKSEKKRLGLLNSPSDERPQVLRTRKASQASASGEVGSSGTDFRLPAPRTLRERKLSQSTPLPRRHGGGKMALFEGLPGAPPASLSAGLAPPLSVVPSYADLPATVVGAGGHDRPYRFSFYSNALSATIHARSLSELPGDGQSFEDMFSGLNGPAAPQEQRRTSSGPGPQLTSPFARPNREDAKIPQVGNGGGAHKPLLAANTVF